mmetsp:Transcript_14633/g.61752  ORF Transcript_14633/g.61752 Transcript_14633/m.61752 type:complete len:313 (-) Transcript_14633:380-1318(-)
MSLSVAARRARVAATDLAVSFSFSSKRVPPDAPSRDLRSRAELCSSCEAMAAAYARAASGSMPLVWYRSPSAWSAGTWFGRSSSAKEKRAYASSSFPAEKWIAPAAHTASTFSGARRSAWSTSACPSANRPPAPPRTSAVAALSRRATSRATSSGDLKSRVDASATEPVVVARSDSEEFRARLGTPIPLTLTLTLSLPCGDEEGIGTGIPNGACAKDAAAASRVSNVGNSGRNTERGGSASSADAVGTAERFSCASQLAVMTNRRPTGVPSSASVSSARLRASAAPSGEVTRGAAGEAAGDALASRRRAREG